jgi:uncharacterized protein YndB with AHSA1/START domain
MNSEDDPGVVLTREFAAPPERVFRAWTDAVTAAKWLFRTPEGLAVHGETDPQEGGEFIFVEEREDERITHVGEYLRVEPPKALDFVFSVDQFRTANEVHVRFEPAGTGTLLTLTHKIDAQWAAFKDRTAKGWETMLDNLERVLRETT